MINNQSPHKPSQTYSPYEPEDIADPWAPTQATEPTPRPIRQQPPPPQWMRTRKRRSGCSRLGCGFLLLLAIPLVFILALYFFAPLSTNVLVLGIDYAPPGSTVGRSDTIIFMSVTPLKLQPLGPKVALLSIPRDLWVNIPGYGENRINTAHFFAEAQQPGAGPYSAMETVRQNFGLGVRYFLRVKFEGFKDVVDAMGGVDIDLEEPIAGYPAGRHHLTGNKALAFARSRMGSDDFFRMQQGQILIKSILRQMMNPVYWPRLPGAALAFLRSVDTNIPVWLWPRLTLALLLTGSDGIDNRTIEREMVTPFTTDQGASVLLPDWSQINPLLRDMFGNE